jgi:putative hydrolase of the HAD superfamily
MSSRRIQAVLFDAAGTLIHLRESVGTTYARSAAEVGVTVPASRLDEAFNRVIAAAPPNVHPGETEERAAELERVWWHQRVHETFRAADGMALFDDFATFFERLFDHFATAEAWGLAEGTEACLEGLAKRRVALAVLSNFDQRLRGILRHLGIHHHFDAVTLPADAGAAKPERQIFDVCLKRLGVPGHRVVYVGDRHEEDVLAAKAAGMGAIDVATLPDLGALPATIDAMEEELQ